MNWFSFSVRSSIPAIGTGPEADIFVPDRITSFTEFRLYLNE